MDIIISNSPRSTQVRPPLNIELNLPPNAASPVPFLLPSTELVPTKPHKSEPPLPSSISPVNVDLVSAICDLINDCIRIHNNSSEDSGLPPSLFLTLISQEVVLRSGFWPRTSLGFLLH